MMYFCKVLLLQFFFQDKMNIKAIYFLLISLIFYSCNDMRDLPTPTFLPATPGETGRLFVLSEGLFNQNNSRLTCFNFGDNTLESDYFTLINKRGLGDTANDMKRYGNKLWIVVNVSSNVEVLDLSTGKSVKQIPMFNPDAIARQPRQIAFSAGKAYVCSFDGTVARIDTTTLEIEKVINCGRNPDGIAVANGKLYVSNSGGLDPGFANTVSVIDIGSFSEIKRITAGINPTRIEADSQGDLYVVSRGNNASIKARWQRINSQTDELAQTFDNIPAVNFTIRNDTAYLYNFDFTDQSYSVQTFDCKTEQLISNSFITDQTAIKCPFGIYAHPTNGNIYITDARTYTVKGDLLCFNRKGKLLYKVESVGLNPNAVVAVED